MKLKADWWDIALAVIVLVVVCVCYGALASFAGAAPVCRVQRVVSPYVAQLAVAPNVYYQVGQSLQREAVDTQQFRHSEEYIELQQLRGFKAGVDAVTASAVTTSGPPQPATGHPATTEEGQTTPPRRYLESTGEPLVPGTHETFKETYPTLAAKCSKCHGGEMPNGDLWLDGTVSLDGPDAAVKRDSIVRKVRTGHMPPNLPEGERLPPDVIDAIEDELYGVQFIAEPTTPPQGEK